MAKYQYRMSLEHDDIYKKSPLVRAAYKIAARAHAGELRYKEPIEGEAPNHVPDASGDGV
jgi:hypothetical protein